ncbi:MAG: phosphoribosylaminoimidazolesuccinocarboxamide synthase [Candidatus Omnitrophota bacterium]
MKKIEMIYEGKAKKLWTTDEKDVLMQEFKDDATAFNAQKKGTIENKGAINNKISSVIFEYLEKNHIPTHFIKQISDREMAVKVLEIIPVEVTIRNIVAGGMSKLLGLEEGIVLDEPVLEYHYKNDALGDPLINEYHIKALKVAAFKDLEEIKKLSFKINVLLKEFFSERKIDLVDFKLEFGRYKGKILLGDEISPDTCRLWEKETQKKLDKDRFRRDLGDVEAAYQEILKRVTS